MVLRELLAIGLEIRQIIVNDRGSLWKRPKTVLFRCGKLQILAEYGRFGRLDVLKTTMEERLEYI
jgi:hypothetical protein